MSNQNIIGNAMTAAQLAVVGYVAWLAYLKRDAIKSFLCLLPGFNELPFCDPQQDPGYDPTDPGTGLPEIGTNPYVPGTDPCNTKQGCEEHGGFWLWLGPWGMCIGGNCTPTDPVDPGTPTDPVDPGTPKDCSQHICMPGGVPYLSSDGTTCLCDYSNKPPVGNSAFGMTEVVSDNLPASITGYVQATCDGYYKYTPPAGYRIDSCNDAPTGSHGGCPDCLMSLVTLVPGSEPTDPYVPPDDPYVPPDDPYFPPVVSKCGNRYTGQEKCASMTYNGQGGLIALTDEEKEGFNGNIIYAVYACDPATGNERRYWCGEPSGVEMCGDYRCSVVMDYREDCANGVQSACNWLNRFAPDYAI